MTWGSRHGTRVLTHPQMMEKSGGTIIFVEVFHGILLIFQTNPTVSGCCQRKCNAFDVANLSALVKCWLLSPRSAHVFTINHTWLVVWQMNFIFHILGINNPN
jgi:hypothetical protein